MPFKLIGTVILVVLVAVLTGFNLDNKCDIWIFHTFKDVPAIVTMISSFVLGVFVTLPFTFGKKRGKKSDSRDRIERNYKKSGKAGKRPSDTMIPTVSDEDGYERREYN